MQVYQKILGYGVPSLAPVYRASSGLLLNMISHRSFDALEWSIYPQVSLVAQLSSRLHDHFRMVFIMFIFLYAPNSRNSTARLSIAIDSASIQRTNCPILSFWLGITRNACAVTYVVFRRSIPRLPSKPRPYGSTRLQLLRGKAKWIAKSVQLLSLS